MTDTSETVAPPEVLGWCEFEYNDRPRVALVVRDTEVGFFTMTPDGFRTFKPHLMLNKNWNSVI